MRILLVACVVGFAATSTAAEPGADSLEQLKALLPSQSHAMMDVEYNFANLWFAAGAANWPLAGFYLNETRSHVQWTVRLRPVRKLASGADLDLAPLLASFEQGGINAVRTAIDAKDRKAFKTAYQATLNLCYGCHVAAEKPFLKPEVPREAPAKLIRMQPLR